jgi:hypothetical protein
MDAHSTKREARKRKRNKRRKLSKAKLQARAEARAAKRRAAKMRTPEDLAGVLGTGRNQTYDLLNDGRVKGAIRVNHRWLIPDAIIERIIAGEAGIIAEERARRRLSNSLPRRGRPAASGERG